MAARGLYRDGEWAQVKHDVASIPIPREQYELDGYLPRFDELPTREEFEAGHA